METKDATLWRALQEEAGVGYGKLQDGYEGLLGLWYRSIFQEHRCWLKWERRFGML